MRISFMRDRWAAEAAHIADFDSPESLHHWLLQDQSGIAWVLAVDHGGEKPVLVLGGQSGILWVRGGWKCPMHVADEAWRRASDVVNRETALDEFIGDAGALIRRAIFPTPKLVRGGDDQ